MFIGCTKEVDFRAKCEVGACGGVTLWQLPTTPRDWQKVKNQGLAFFLQSNQFIAERHHSQFYIRPDL